MAARTTGRAKFDFRGRQFVWWVEEERFLRVVSLDKKFVISYAMSTYRDELPSVEVAGSEFPGVEPSERRPIWLVGPPWLPMSMGARFERLLTWSFDPSGSRERLEARPRSI